MKRLLFAVMLAVVGCNEVPDREIVIDPVSVPEKATDFTADEPLECEPGVAELLVGGPGPIAEPGECFAASECWGNDYGDYVEIACWFDGCEEPDVQVYDGEGEFIVEMRNPCAD